MKTTKKQISAKSRQNNGTLIILEGSLFSSSSLIFEVYGHVSSCFPVCRYPQPMGFMAMVAPPLPEGIMAQPCGALSEPTIYESMINLLSWRLQFSNGLWNWGSIPAAKAKAKAVPKKRLAALLAATNGILEPNEIVIEVFSSTATSEKFEIWWNLWVDYDEFVLPGRAEKSRRDVPHERVKLRMRWNTQHVLSALSIFYLFCELYFIQWYTMYVESIWILITTIVFFAIILHFSVSNECFVVFCLQLDQVSGRGVISLLQDLWLLISQVACKPLKGSFMISRCFMFFF